VKFFALPSKNRSEIARMKFFYRMRTSFAMIISRGRKIKPVKGKNYQDDQIFLA